MYDEAHTHMRRRLRFLPSAWHKFQTFLLRAETDTTNKCGPGYTIAICTAAAEAALTT